MQAVAGEQDATTRRRVCFCIEALASSLAATFREVGPASWWPALIPAVLELAGSDSTGIRESGLFLIDKIADATACSSQTDWLVAEAGGMLGVISNNCLGEGPPVSTRVAAVRATASLIAALNANDSSHLDGCAALLPMMIDVIVAALNSGDELEARESLQSLAELARHAPRFFEDAIVDVAACMMTVANTEDLDVETRRAGCEVLVTIAEAAPGVLRRAEQVVTDFVTLSMQLMCQMDDDDDWVTDDYPEYAAEADAADAEDDTISGCGDGVLARITAAVGGRLVLPVAFGIIPELAGNADWRQRCAAARSVTAIAGGATKQLQRELSKVIELVVPLTADPHVRVRFAAVECLAIIADDFGGRFQKYHMSAVLPAIIAAMSPGEGNCVRVCGHAASAVVNMLNPEHCELKHIAEGLMPLLEALFQLLNVDVRAVQEAVLEAVACAAKVAGEEFGAVRRGSGGGGGGGRRRGYVNHELRTLIGTGGVDRAQ